MWTKSYSVPIQMKISPQYLHTIPAINFEVFSKEINDQWPIFGVSESKELNLRDLKKKELFFLLVGLCCLKAITSKIRNWQTL